MVDWLFGDLLYWLNAILWCINLFFLFIFWFLVLHIGFVVDEKIVKDVLFRINVLNIISEKISYLPFTCFPCREG